jgi:ankyrin repeat protein
MTPLLWAFPDNKLERFKRLLEHGADPNVVIESDFNTLGGMRSGDSVTHMACKTAFPGYFEAVFAHGGDPNLNKDGIISNETPLFTLITGSAPNKKAKVRLLIEKGADLDHKSGTGRTAVRVAVGRSQFDIALMLLEARTDYKAYLPNSNSKLIHSVVEKENLKATWTAQQNADYQKLVSWLESHGESFENARADKRRWQSWSLTTGEYQRKMAAEVAARKTREVRGNVAAHDGNEQDE